MTNRLDGKAWFRIKWHDFDWIACLLLCHFYTEVRIFQSCNNRYIYISHKRHGWHYGLSCMWYAVLFMGFQTIFITRLLKNIVSLATFYFTLLFLFLLLLFARFQLRKCFVAHLWPLYGIYFGYPKWKRLENKMNCMDMSNWCQVCTLCSIHDVQWLWFQWKWETLPSPFTNHPSTTESQLTCV